jgi:dihydroflavonol-4-reductase
MSTSQQTALVTGASGFLGTHLVRKLVAEGWHVRALLRPSSSDRFLRGFDYEPVYGDVTDAASLLRAIPEHADAVFHVAASTNLWRPRNDEQFQVNVVGARNLVEAALARRVRRLVHTSSTAAFGPEDGDVLRECQESRGERHWVNYFRTKRLAELEVHSGIERGLDAVILNPGNVLGPFDTHNWSRLLRLVRRGTLPAMLPGAAPWAHVRSVTNMQLAAFERGRTGHHYLLGEVSASYAELGQELIRVSGAGKLPIAAPRQLLRALARFNELVSLLSGRAPDLTPESVHLASLRYSCDTSKARSELGYRETTLRQMVEDTFAWMVTEEPAALPRYQDLPGSA